MILYAIKSTLCLAAVIGIYHLLLDRESMHRFKRFFLLGALGFSFAIPLIAIGHSGYIASSIATGQHIVEVMAGDASTPLVTPQWHAFSIVSMVYLLIAAALFLRYAFRVATLIRKARRNRNISYKNATLVLVEEPIEPYTFCRYIFIHKDDYLSGAIEQEVLTHELTHVEQGHSIDVLTVELFRVVFWFNPILLFVKRAIQANHEFLADRAVVETHQCIPHYQRLLVNKVTNTTRVQLTSNFTYLLTKKRLKMMTKSTEKLRARFFIAATLPLMAALVLLFGKTTYAQDGGAEGNAEIRSTIDSYFKDAVFVCSDGDELKVYTPYQALSEAEKNKIPPLPPSKVGTAPIPLPKGTVVSVTEDGQVRILKNADVPPPPPPMAPPAQK